MHSKENDIYDIIFGIMKIDVSDHIREQRTFDSSLAFTLDHESLRCLLARVRGNGAINEFFSSSPMHLLSCTVVPNTTMLQISVWLLGIQINTDTSTGCRSDTKIQYHVIRCGGRCCANEQTYFTMGIKGKKSETTASSFNTGTLLNVFKQDP